MRSLLLALSLAALCAAPASSQEKLSPDKTAKLLASQDDKSTGLMRLLVQLKNSKDPLKTCLIAAGESLKTGTPEQELGEFITDVAKSESLPKTYLTWTEKLITQKRMTEASACVTLAEDWYDREVLQGMRINRLPTYRGMHHWREVEKAGDLRADLGQKQKARWNYQNALRCLKDAEDEAAQPLANPENAKALVPHRTRLTKKIEAIPFMFEPGEEPRFRP